MKLNISYPATGCQKLIDIDDQLKLRPFYDQRMAAELPADALGDEWKGYIVRISGGNDKEGFPMKQGVLTTGRVRLLLSKGHSCYRPRREGERKRKSVRGCIVDANLSVLCLVIVKKGEQDIPGLTDKTIPRRLGPKRASKIRKLFNLSKDDDVRKYVVRRPAKVKEGKKPRTKAPKIQRLLTPAVLQRKRAFVKSKKDRSIRKREDAADYAKLLAQRMKEAKERKRERRRSNSKSKGDSVSVSKDTKEEKKPAPKVAKVVKEEKKPAPKVTKVEKKAAPKVTKVEKKAAPKVTKAEKKPAPKASKDEKKPAAKKPKVEKKAAPKK